MVQTGCVTFSTDQPDEPVRVNRNPYRVLLTVEETLKLLVFSATKMHTGHCVFADCDTCNGARACWWDVYNVLRREDKHDVAIALAGHGIDLPDGPWELED
jgi:hypothetical protein